MHKRFRHLCLALAALIAAGTLLAALIPAAEAATYKKGSSGAVVSQIQTKLKNWGYYAGDVDGIYGSATERAVRAFQRKNGLTADGKAGAQTLEALGLPADSGGNSGGSGGMTGAQVDLLARLISAEARGEPYSGQVAVGAVVLNRIRHPSFPNTLSGVIYQSGAFTCITDGQFNEPVAESAYRAARTRSMESTHPAVRSTISIPRRPQARGSGRAHSSPSSVSIASAPECPVTPQNRGCRAASPLHMDTRKNVAKKFKNTIDNCPCKVLYYQTREGCSSRTKRTSEKS